MRRFELHRSHDVSGVSGTGVVAEGVEFEDGSCAMRWRGELGSTVIHKSIDTVEAIHGHGGATKIVWVDPKPGTVVVLNDEQRAHFAELALQDVASAKEYLKTLLNRAKEYGERQGTV